MRIVLAPFGSRGDLQPFLALGQALRAKGHDVLVAAAPSYRQWVEEEGLGFREAGGDLESWLRRRGRTATRPLSLYRALAAFVRDGAPLWFQQTCAAVRDADLVVATLHLAARSAAEALRIPCRTILFTPQLLPSRAHPPPGIPAVFLPGRINRVLWSAFARVFDGSFRGAINRERAKLGLPPIRSFLAHARGTSPIVASDPELAPIPADADSQPVQTGAIVSRADGPLSDELEAFLAAGEPPVYVGFGSMPDRAPELTSRLIAEAVRGAGRRAILCAGWSGLGEMHLPPELLAIRGAPHSLLFPRVSAVVHHGGAGTTAAACRAGVPQVVVPHTCDQFFHGERVRRLGLGTEPVPRGRLDAARLARALVEATTNPELRSRSRAMAERLSSTDGVTRCAELFVAG